MNSVYLKSQRLKKFTLSGCKDKGIGKLKFVGIIEILFNMNRTKERWIGFI